MNYSEMSYSELSKIFRAVRGEMFIRTWWVIPIMIVVFGIIYFILKKHKR